MGRPWWFGLMLVVNAAWASEPVHGCFRSPAEAVLMAPGGGSQTASFVADEGRDVVQGDTFRLESVRRDVLLGRSWAVVRSCEHPERPALVIDMLQAAGAVNTMLATREAESTSAVGRGRSRARESSGDLESSVPDRAAATFSARTLAGATVLVAGSRVQVVRVEQNVRLTMLAVAERSAAIGERVRLRVVREAGEGEEFIEGVVRGARLVEMEGIR